jgi:hypothetical protein
MDQLRLMPKGPGLWWFVSLGRITGMSEKWLASFANRVLLVGDSLTMYGLRVTRETVTLLAAYFGGRIGAQQQGWPQRILGNSL